MRKAIILLVAAFLIAGMASAESGAIWTTHTDCGDETQDVNHFSVGQDVHINGAGFDANTTYYWAITGQPGGASCDPKIVVANGTKTTDGSGAFCIHAYTVQADDCGEYTVDFGKKNDNYRVDGIVGVPEFASMGMLAAALLAISGSAYLINKKRE